MERFLNIQISETERSFIIQIITQTHRGDTFHDKLVSYRDEYHTGMFKSSEGFVLASKTFPEIGISDGILYLRGSNYYSDNMKLEIYKDKDGIEYVRRLRMAVTEYNEVHNNPNRLERISIRRKHNHEIHKN